jgi:hypothetical protein
MMGARKMPNEAMKLSSDAAEVMIFHGTMTQPPMMVAMTAARRRLMYLGKREAISLETEMTFAETLTPIWATIHASPLDWSAKEELERLHV